MSCRGHWSRRYLCKSLHNTVQSQHSTGDIKDLLGSIVSTGPIRQQRFLKHHCLRTNHMTLSNRKSLNRPLCDTTSKPSIHREGWGRAMLQSAPLFSLGYGRPLWTATSKGKYTQTGDTVHFRFNNGGAHNPASECENMTYILKYIIKYITLGPKLTDKKICK